MQFYLILKSIVMLIAIVFAFKLFFIKIRRLYAIMMAVEGKTENPFNRIKDRITVLFTDVLGQSNVRRKALPGISHTMIFFGFLAIQIHSLELMIRGVFPSFDLLHFIPFVYSKYLFLADIFAFFVLVGFGYALYRRLVIKPPYLTMGRDANLIILFTCVIVISFHFINAFQSFIPVEIEAEGANNVVTSLIYKDIFPISGILASILGLQNWSYGMLIFGYEIFYYIHIFTILGFLIYIPGSKHLHLLAAAPNVFFKPLDVEKAIEKTDIENEEASSFGLAKVSEFNWHNVLNLYACTECGRCEELCPAANTGKPLSPKKIIHDFKIDLFEQSDALLTMASLPEPSKNRESILPIMREGSEITHDVLWSCTTCRSCEDVCPVNNEHLNFIFEIRKNQVLMEAAFPPEMQETFSNLENQSNPWGFSSDTRADWCKGMGIPLMMDKPDAKVLYFVGCAGSFDDRGKKISQATARVLQKAGVDFAILGPEESCNGDMARRAGNEYLAQMLIQQNVEIFKQYNPSMILTGCPHCYNVIKNEYPQFGAKFKVLHHTEYILELLKEGRLVSKDKNFGTITFHDSCYLGRWNNIYTAPRKILEQINSGSLISSNSNQNSSSGNEQNDINKNGSRLIEMDRNMSRAMCCGAGGARMFMEETIGQRINNVRAKEAVATGASMVCVSCPFCITMLNDGIMESERQIPVKDIAELVDEGTI
ncbi:MAG: (Fe-S)-binding protein [Desulfamplus sp.]|nr:(Fe-S)-binding protein [Desulfamplus sp.]